MPMKFSVVIPLYNKAPYVQRSIESALAQTYVDFEIIVIDDGSTDRSAAIVAALSDPRIRLVHQSNAGVSAARNHGVRLARGEWVTFLDADDWQHPDYLATLLKLAKWYPYVDAVATRYFSIDHTECSKMRSWPTLAEDAEVELIDDLPGRWMLSPSLCTCSIAIRTSVLQRMQPCFPEGESSGEDLDLWFRLAEISEIALSSAPLIARIWVPDGLSVLMRQRCESPFLLRLEQRAKGGMLSPAIAASSIRFVNDARISLARSAIVAGYRRTAIGLLWRSRSWIHLSRWWVTLGMLLVMPGRLIHHWQHWRVSRKVIG